MGPHFGMFLRVNSIALGIFLYFVFFWQFCLYIFSLFWAFLAYFVPDRIKVS